MITSAAPAVDASIGREDGRVVFRFVHRTDRRPDEVWRILTASPFREGWIGCGDPVELRDCTTVQPPFWPTATRVRDASPPAWTGVTRVWQAPAVFEWSSEDDGVVRWEISAATRGTSVSVTSWIDSEDVPTLGATGADQQLCFERLVHVIETGAAARPRRSSEVVALASRYAAAAAAALADTD